MSKSDTIQPFNTPRPAFKATFQGVAYTDVIAYSEAVSAFEIAVTAERAAAKTTTKATGPLAFSVTGSGKLAIRATNGDRYGAKYPIMELQADTAKMLIAHWPEVVAAVEANIASLSSKVDEMRAWRAKTGRPEPADLGPTGF